MKVPRAVSNRRLLKLATFLEKLPRKRFDYSTYVGPDWEGAPDLSCGTTACAAGWATTIPEFRRLGARLCSARYPENLDEVLGLTQGEADFLFFPNSLFLPKSCGWRSPAKTATAKQVAKHIRRFVKARE